ncbi:ParM/StbA family protein [Bacillus megaterium]|nr:ParM/StbA family protein [Priestia megaterium]
MSTNLIRDVYAIDLGNGFSKRCFNGKAIVDPAVFAIPTSYYGTDNKKTININDTRDIYIGNDAFESGYLVENAIGEEDIKRYDSTEYKELLLGFMGKDLKQDTVIQLLILGLPVKHFKAKREELQESYGNKKFMVTAKGKQIVIEVKKCIVIPQPLGTYMYLESSKDFDTKTSKTLVIDGGSGTLDVTEMKGQEVLSTDGSNLGMNEPYEAIAVVLESKYNGLEINVNHVPDILLNGLRFAGSNIQVNDMKEIVAILDMHFKRVVNRVISKYKSFNKFDNVVWTGGMALSHSNRINAMNQPNFMILKDGQTANVKGYYEFGRGLVQSGSKSSVRTK